MAMHVFIVRQHLVINRAHPRRRVFDVDIVARLFFQVAGGAQVGVEYAAVPPTHFVARARLPLQRRRHELDSDLRAPPRRHFGRRRQQIIAVEHRRRRAGIDGDAVEQRALFREADFGLVEVAPLVIHRRNGFGWVANQKSMREHRQQFIAPQVRDVVREIFDEHRIGCGRGF